MRAIAFGIGLAIVAVPNAGAQVVPKNITETASTEYYPVRGISVEALSAELRRLSPMGPDGHQVMGEYDGSFRFTPTLTVAGNTCVATVRVDVTSKTVLPKWIDAASAEGALQRQWRFFVSRLAEHETAHRIINLTISSEMQQAMTTLRAPSCQALSSAIFAKAAEFQARYTREQASFDATTNHGVKQGVVWPVPSNVILLGRPPQ